MRVLGASVDLQLLNLLCSQLVLGQHALHSLLNRTNRVGFKKLCIVDGLQTAGVTRVAVCTLLFKLCTGQGDLLSVHDDHEIAGVHVRGKSRLVLTAQQDSGLACEATEHHVGGINDVPLALNFAGLRSISAQNIGLCLEMYIRRLVGYHAYYYVHDESG